MRTANRRSRTLGYERQLDDNFVRSLGRTECFLIATAVHTDEGGMRCVILSGAEGHSVTLDVDPALYATLDDMPIPQPIPSRN